MSIENPTNDLELLLHVAKDPVRFLGASSLPFYQAFLFGYECNVPADVTFHELPALRFEEFVLERFPVSTRWPDNMSAKCYVHFLGPDDARAFDLFVELRRAYFDSYPPNAGEFVRVERAGFDQLLDFVRQRPRMYFSQTPDLMGCLVSLFNGGIEAERVFTGISPTESRLRDFELWLNARYPWALGRPWHRILRFTNLWEPEWSLKAFWTHFDLFRSGEPPDALTPTAKHLFETNPGLEGMSEEQRQADRRQLNRIFYRE